MSSATDAVAAGYRQLGDHYVAAGDHAEAEIWYRRSLAEAAAAEVHLGLARALVRLNRCDEAEDHLRRALRLDASRNDAVRELATLFADQGRLVEAASALRVLLANGAHPEEQLDYADLLLGLGALDDAERHYRQLMAVPGAPPEAAANLGALLASRGRAADAERLLERAATALPTAATLTNHGNALVDLGRLDEAEDRFRHALALDPDCGEAQWGLAELYDRRGESERAEVARRRAVRLRPRLAQRCVR